MYIYIYIYTCVHVSDILDIQIIPVPNENHDFIPLWSLKNNVSCLFWQVDVDPWSNFNLDASLKYLCSLDFEARGASAAEQANAMWESQGLKKAWIASEATFWLVNQAGWSTPK